MHASLESRSDNVTPALETSSPTEETAYTGDEESGLRPPHSVPATSATSPNEGTGQRTQPKSIGSSTGGYIKRKTSELLEAVSSSSKSTTAPLAPKLAALVDSYAQSDVALGIKAEGDEIQRRLGQPVEVANGHGSANDLRDVAVETSLLRGRKRASLWTQFRILSGRAFKNLYRDPALLAAHYTSSIALACEFLAQFMLDLLLTVFGLQ